MCLRIHGKSTKDNISSILDVLQIDFVTIICLQTGYLELRIHWCQRNYVIYNG